MQLERNLEQLGLTEKEAKIYLAALELGADTVQNIAEKANIKRPTAYVVIDALVKKGFIAEQITDGGNVYIAEHPEKFASAVESQQRTLQNTLPLLKALYNIEKNKPQVRVYEGKEGILAFYQEHLFKTNTEVLFFSSIRKINESLPDFLDLWLSLPRHKQFPSRELINADPDDLAYAHTCLAAKTKQQLRVLPNDFPFRFVGSDNAIFEDKIMFVSFEEKLFTTVIESKVLSDTMRTLYELAWRSAVPIHPVSSSPPPVRLP
ncbi:MAG: helix-turn-helix domain-containing protein [Patescibacteria group bacterium]